MREQVPHRLPDTSARSATSALGLRFEFRDEVERHCEPECGTESRASSHHDTTDSLAEKKLWSEMRCTQNLNIIRGFTIMTHVRANTGQVDMLEDAGAAWVQRVELLTTPLGPLPISQRSKDRRWNPGGQKPISGMLFG